MLTTKKTFYINSAYRLSGVSSDFQIGLDISPDDQFTHACVLACQIPKSYYTCRAGFNTFTIRLSGSGSFQDFIISLPPGNYSRRSLARVLESTVNAAFGPEGTLAVSFAPPNDYDTGKYLFTYSNLAHPYDTVEMIFTTNVYYMLGFRANSSVIAMGAPTVQIASEVVIDLQLESQIFIRSDLVQNDSGDNVLVDIYPASGEPNFSNIHYEVIDRELCEKTIRTSTSNIFRFYLQDQLGAPIELNGLDIQITLVVYRKSQIIRKISGFINWLISGPFLKKVP